MLMQGALKLPLRFWRWLAESTDLADRMETLGFEKVILNRRPIQGALVTALVSPGMFIPINWVLYGVWVPPSYQWYSALYGDLLLAVAVGILLWMAEAAPSRGIHTRYEWLNILIGDVWYLRVPLNLLLVLAIYAFAWTHMMQEHASIGSWERHLGATSSYHNFIVYPILGYVLLRLLFRAVFRVAWRHWRTHALPIVLVLWLIYGWRLLGEYDGSHQLAPNGVSKNMYSSPPDGWHNLRLAWEWLLSMVDGLLHPLFDLSDWIVRLFV